MKSNRMILRSLLAITCCALIGGAALWPQDDGPGSGDLGSGDGEDGLLELEGEPARGWLLRDPNISWTKDFVGINVKSPTARLDVKGTARFRNDVRFDQFVGIGTSDPIHPLHVSAFDNAVISIESGTGGFPVYSAIDFVDNGVLEWGIGKDDFNRFYFDEHGPGGTARRLTIDEGGNVGIGTSNPSFQLHLSEDSAGKPTSNTWTISSDARLKKNVETIKNALDDLLALRGVTYQWIDPSTQGGMDGVYTGMIAQEVEPIFPEWVREDESGYKTLTVIGFEGLVVEALRELRSEKDAKIAELSARVQEALARNAELEARLVRLEAALMELEARE